MVFVGKKIASLNIFCTSCDLRFGWGVLVANTCFSRFNLKNFWFVFHSSTSHV